MWRRVRTFCLVGAVATGPLAGQGPGGGDTAGARSPAQLRYTDGLRLAGRGIAQLKDGIARVARQRSDTAQLRLAGRRLGGLCNSAGSFMRRGRANMSHTAYTDSVRAIARRLNTQIDSVIAYLPTCQRQGGPLPQQTAAQLLSRLRGYEAALQKFREALTPPPAPVQPDSQ